MSKHPVHSGSWLARSRHSQSAPSARKVFAPAAAPSRAACPDQRAANSSCSTTSACTSRGPSDGNALYSNTQGIGNVANGYTALFSNTIGGSNVATGYAALYYNTVGLYNTAVGNYALANNTGTANIAIGNSAGSQITTGSNNIEIGNSGVAGDDAVIRIGNSFQGKTYIAGIFGFAANGGSQVYVDSTGKLGTAASSRRFKTDIADMGAASDVLLAMRPVSFRYKPQPDAKAADAKAIPQFGLIAEEVAELNPGLVVRDGKGEIYSVRYEAVNAMLLNEFLKEHRRVADLKQRLVELEARDKALEARDKALEARLSKLEQFVPAREPFPAQAATK